MKEPCGTLESNADVMIDGGSQRSMDLTVNGAHVICNGDIMFYGNYFIFYSGLIENTKKGSLFSDAITYSYNSVYTNTACGKYKGDESYNKVEKLSIDKLLTLNEEPVPVTYLKTGGQIAFYSELNYDITLDADWAAFDLAVPLAEGSIAHKITAEDFGHITFLNMPDNLEPYFDETAQTITLRAKQPSNVATTEDDLQRMLDEIAERGTATEAQPDTIVVAEGGIVVGNISVPEKCHAYITGGSINPCYKAGTSNGERVFEVKGSLKFENIDFDFAECDNDNFICYFRLQYPHGTLVIGDGVRFLNNSGRYTSLCSITKGTRLDYHSGEFTSDRSVVTGHQGGSGTVNLYGGELMSAKSVIDCAGALVNNYGAKIETWGEMAVNVGSYNMYGGVIMGGTKSIVYASTVGLYGGYIYGASQITYTAYMNLNASAFSSLPTIAMAVDANSYCKLNLMSSPADRESKIVLMCDWANMPADKNVVGGYDGKYLNGYDYNNGYVSLPAYTMLESDLEWFDFADMPATREAYYDADVQAIRIREKKGAGNSDDLQDFLDSLKGGGDSGEEQQVPIDPEGLDLDGGVGIDDLQAFIDGLKDDGTKTDINVNDEGRIDISETGGLRLDNVVIVPLTGVPNPSTLRTYPFIYCRGNLVVERNVEIQKFYSFVHIYRGGCVTWRTSCVMEAETEVIYNEGGKVVIDGQTSFPGGIRNYGDIYFGGDDFTGVIYHHRGGRIYVNRLIECITRDIHIDINIDVTDIELHTGIICGHDGYRLTRDDMNHITIHLPEGYEWYYDDIEFTIKIRKQVTDHDDLQDWMDRLAGSGELGTEADPLGVSVCGCGATLSGDVTVNDDLQLFIDGLKGDGTSTAFTFDGGMFHIPYSTYLRITNLDFFGTNGDSYFRVGGKLYVDQHITITRFRRFIHVLNGGTVVWNCIDDAEATDEVIYNEGRVEVLYGTFTGGIRNAGWLVLGGDSFSGVIHHVRGGRIYVNRLLQSITRDIHIDINISVGDIELDEPIILGCDGYTLTEADLEHVTIHLPEGYEWQLIDGQVVICLPSGIAGVEAGANAAAAYYDMTGNRIAAPRRGVNIVRMADGSVRKVVVE